VESSLWKFEILDSAQLRRIASDEGADADILMIATRAEFGLTDPVQAWLRTSFSSRRSPPLALVGLIHPDEPGAFVTLSVRDYLRQVAEQNGTELFVNEWEERAPRSELAPTSREPGPFGAVSVDAGPPVTWIAECFSVGLAGGGGIENRSSRRPGHLGFRSHRTRRKSCAMK
jgi:hypothetical protein